MVKIFNIQDKFIKKQTKKKDNGFNQLDLMMKWKKNRCDYFPKIFP